MQSTGLGKVENVSWINAEQKIQLLTRGRRRSKFLVCARGCEGFPDLYDILLFGMGRRSILEEMVAHL
jgi:hypothetical protein